MMSRTAAGWGLSQPWMFGVVPILGALAGALGYNAVAVRSSD